MSWIYLIILLILYDLVVMVRLGVWVGLIVRVMFEMFVFLLVLGWVLLDNVFYVVIYGGCWDFKIFIVYVIVYCFKENMEIFFIGVFLVFIFYSNGVCFVG